MPWGAEEGMGVARMVNMAIEDGWVVLEMGEGRNK
jgi:hypothetical protein